MLKLALIGCGRHARAHHGSAMAHYRRQHPDAIDLVAACDRDLAAARRLADEFGFRRACDDMDQLLASEALDGCVTVMPIAAIAPVAIALLERGMPCTIEKPLGATLDEARQLAAVAARCGTTHLVSVDRRFNPLLVEALSWCREQGPIRHISAAMLRHARGEPLFIEQTGVHVVDALRFLAGEVVQYDVRHLGGAGEHWRQVTARFDSGIVADLKIFPTTGWSTETYELFGEGYRARVEIMPGRGGRMECCREDRAVRTRVIEPADYNFLTCGAYGELEAFVAALRGGGPAHPTIADVLPSLELCDRIATDPRHGERP